MVFTACFTLLQGVLQQAHSANASYLFQQDKFYDVSYDTGDKSIQCGRKVDVLKVWMMWKAKGHFGFAAKIDNAFDMAGYVTFVFVVIPSLCPCTMPYFESVPMLSPLKNICMVIYRAT